MFKLNINQNIGRTPGVAKDTFSVFMVLRLCKSYNFRWNIVQVTKKNNSVLVTQLTNVLCFNYTVFNSVNICLITWKIHTQQYVPSTDFFAIRQQSIS